MTLFRSLCLRWKSGSTPPACQNKIYNNRQDTLRGGEAYNYSIDFKSVSKILIIEDDNFLLSLMVEKFIQIGFDAEAAMDGEDGLNKIINNKYDLVLLDIILPKMDGFKVLEEIKKNQSLKNLPIIVASNLYNKNDIDKAFSLGASDYIIKAYNSPENIADRVKVFLQKK